MSDGFWLVAITATPVALIYAWVAADRWLARNDAKLQALIDDTLDAPDLDANEAFFDSRSWSERR